MRYQSDSFQVLCSTYCNEVTGKRKIRILYNHKQANGIIQHWNHPDLSYVLNYKFE